MKGTEEVMDSERSNADLRPVLLWISLTESDYDPVLPYSAENHYRIQLIRTTKHIDAIVDAVAPSVLCFEYDYPSDAGLAALTKTKRDYPAIPILMLTAYHSQPLALWALRARVWDYIVKPVSAEDILRSAVSLFEVSCQQRTSLERRALILPLDDFEYLHEVRGAEKAILRAQSYIYQNLSENIRLADVANYCHVSRSHLSRIFKDAGGITFTEFVLQAKTRRAAELLTASDTNVTDICYEVGFQDVSHFGRVFRRYVGMSPSQYRKALINNVETNAYNIPFLPA